MEEYSFWHTLRDNLARRVHRLVTIMGLTLSLLGCFTSAEAKSLAQKPLCGNGSPPDYGFSYDLLQPHWTVGWELYASQQAVDRVDLVLDRLNEDAISQTMILLLPQDQVGIPTNCAVHFLRICNWVCQVANAKTTDLFF